MTPLIDYIHTTDYTPCYGSYSMAICCWLVAICDVDVSCHVVGVYVYIYIYIYPGCLLGNVRWMGHNTVGYRTIDQAVGCGSVCGRYAFDGSVGGRSAGRSVGL